MLKKLKKWLLRLFVAIRKKIREIENKLDVIQPHPLIGALFAIAGVAVCIAGIAMMVLPGPGMVTIALGVAMIIISVRIMRSEYGPERKARKLIEKKARLEKKDLDQSIDLDQDIKRDAEQ